MGNNCKDCIHRIVCKAWMKELELAEECYTGSDYVTIFDRYNVDGDGCEQFEED